MNNKKQDNFNYPRLRKKWANEPSQSDLQADLDEAESSRNDQIEKILQYREDMEGGKELNPKLRDRGKSTQRPLVIRKQAEWAYPIMEEPFLSTQDMFNIQPRGPGDEQAAKLNSMLLNWFMSTKINKTALVGDLVRTIYDEGTVILKDGWHTTTEEIEVESMEPVYGSPEESLAALQQMVQSGEMNEAQAQAMMEMGEPVQIGEEKVINIETKIIDNHPTLDVMDNTNIIVDPTCDGDIKKAQFIIHEYETSYAELKKQEFRSRDVVEDGVVRKVTSGIYRNLKNVKFEAASEDPYGLHDDVNKTTFFFKDKPRKKVKAYEYWGFWDIEGKGELEPIVATWIGDVMIRLEKNPYPHQELPFSVARYMPRKKEFWGQPDGELLRENQDTIGVYTRAMQDQTITNALGQKLVDESLFNSPSQWQAFNKGNNARFRPGANPDQMIWKSKIEPIDKSAFDMIHYQRNEAEGLTGQKAFSDGISGNALGNSVGGIRSAMDATTKRRLSVLRRISDELLRTAARHILLNAQEFVDEETVIRLSDGEFVEVLKQDIQMEFDLRVDINTPEKEKEISDKIAFMLQTTAQTMPLDMTKSLLKKWAVNNKMLDVAKDIEEIQPPGPSEAQQQLEQMQLENAMLENQKLKAEIAKIAKDTDRVDAHIYEAMGRLDDNRDKKASTAQVQQAQARKLESETDEIDRAHLDKLDGVARQESLEDQQFKMDGEMAKLAQAKIQQEKQSNKKGNE